MKPTTTATVMAKPATSGTAVRHPANSMIEACRGRNTSWPVAVLAANRPVTRPRRCTNQRGGHGGAEDQRHGPGSEVDQNTAQHNELPGGLHERAQADRDRQRQERGEHDPADAEAGRDGTREWPAHSVALFLSSRWSFD